MSGKWQLEELKVGPVMEATFWQNPVSESQFRFRATHLDGKRAPKVVLCDDPRVRPGVPCMVRITSVTKPERDDRGTIEVEFVRAQEFRLEGVYVDPIIRKKLQVALESGLNILLDGPQGCGKTVLARTIAKQLVMEFVFFNCGAVVDATDFFASMLPLNPQMFVTFIPTDVLEKTLSEFVEQPGLMTFLSVGVVGDKVIAPPSTWRDDELADVVREARENAIQFNESIAKANDGLDRALGRAGARR